VRGLAPPPGESGCIFKLELRPSTPIMLVLSVDDDFCSQPMADRRLLDDPPPTAARPVAFDIVLDFVIPRAFGEVVAPPTLGVSGLVVFEAVLGREGVCPLWADSLAVFSLMVAESTVFCRLKFEFVCVFEDRGTAVGGQALVSAPVEPRRGLLVALMERWTPRCEPAWAGDGAEL